MGGSPHFCHKFFTLAGHTRAAACRRTLPTCETLMTQDAETTSEAYDAAFEDDLEDDFESVGEMACSTLKSR
jgi:hypothetical protein